MFPGVELSSLKKFAEGEKHVVTIIGNVYPFAVGRMDCDIEKAQKNKFSGRALKLVHVFTDYLYDLILEQNLNVKGEVPKGFSKNQVFPTKQESFPQDLENITQEKTQKRKRINLLKVNLNFNAEINRIEVQIEQQNVVDAELMQNFFEYCYDLYEEKAGSSNKEINMEIGQFFQKIVEKYKEINSDDKDAYLDIKKSSFKKVSVFFEHLKNENYISIEKPGGPGSERVKEINFKNNSKLNAFIKEKKEKLKQENELKQQKEEVDEDMDNDDAKMQEIFEEMSKRRPANAQEKQIEFVKLRKPHSSFESLFFSPEQQQAVQESEFLLKEGLVLEANISKYLQNYVKSKNLSIKPTGKQSYGQFMVKVDEFLSKYLTADEKAALSAAVQQKKVFALPITTFIERVIEKSGPFYLMSLPNQPIPILKKGDIPIIEVRAKNIMGNKKVTEIYGLEAFQIPYASKNFQTSLSKLLSVSVRTKDPLQCTNVEPDIVVQGEKIRELCAFLIDNYSIGAQFITTKNRASGKSRAEKQIKKKPIP